MPTRRNVLLSAGAVGLVAAAPAPSADAALAQTLDRMLQEDLRLRPEGASQLGLDKGANADLKSKLSDLSLAGLAAAKRLNRDQLRRLASINRSELSPAGRVDLDTVAYTRQSAADIHAFAFGGASYGPSPYVVSQMTGAYQSVPDFLDTKHALAGAPDAEAYLARLEAFAGQIRDQTDKMRHDAALGVTPPDFLLDTALIQLQKTAVAADQAPVVQSLVRRSSALGLADVYGRRAVEIYDRKVLPALTAQIGIARELRRGARHDAGVWAVKDGAAFYTAALRATTTTAMTPEAVHKVGLDQAKTLSSKLDALLKARGLTQGTVGARMAALYADPSQLYANTDAGKAQAIAYCNARLDAIRQKLPQVFDHLPPYAFEVRRVPPQTEAGAASAFSQGPALDGSRPGLVYFNLHDAAEWPKFCLATTVFHEGLPGHQLEGGLALANPHLSLIRKTLGFSGYAEGWALYAEQLADEIGMYDDDPLGRLGYLKFQLFRANRCVVDTGIHHLRWSREQAVAYFVDQEGEAPGFATREVERYCAIPGQACSYKLGHNLIVGLRDKARARMGSRFDLKTFHAAILGSGRAPLEVLQRVGEAWIEASGRNTA